MMRQLASSLVCAALVLAALASLASAAPIALRQGRLALEFDETSGGLLKIECDGQPLAEGSPAAANITFGVGPVDKIVWFDQMRLPPKLVKHASPSPATLELTIAAGPYEWVETYKLHADVPRLDRWLRLTNRGSETVKLRGLAFRTPGIKVGGDGFYRFPMQWPPHGQPFADMQPGRRRNGSGASVAPVLAQLAPRRTVFWASYADDRSHPEVIEGQGSFEERQFVAAAGYLRPNQPQDIGLVSMQVVDADYWAALPRLWDWMDSVGLKVPADRPRWLNGAVLYSFHPGGTIGSGFRDLGGFQAATDRLLPTLPRLGVDSIWIMPIEYRSPYWPLDYYRFMDGIGTAEQYKQLVARAHGLGLHVLQDLVPHGGAPMAVHNQQHPEFMLRREDGTTLDYWLNDFAWPAWQKYIAGVADYYVRTYDIDGYRVDACYGSKELNWNPDIPYARASLSQLCGGLDMLAGIRSAVRKLKPESGAILGEVESARHQAVTDFVYDFNFCYNVCQQWRKMDAGPFVAALQEYFEEQKYAEPRGAMRLRHIESHDALRAQLWYGVEGMRTMYALSAWIDGVPLIYHGMEVGSSGELAAINQVRHQRPELCGGEACYRAVTCDVPGVFVCLRRLGERSSVVVINFNREPVKATLQWPGRRSTLNLAPLAYTVLPQGEPPAAKPQALRGTSGDRGSNGPGTASGATAGLSSSAQAAKKQVASETLGEAAAFDNATEWFVDTIEGRLHDVFDGPRENGQVAMHGSIYWRPQGGGVLWQNATAPLHPGTPRLGVKLRSGKWHIVQFDAPTAAELRLVERYEDRAGLHLLGAGGLKARVYDVAEQPPAPDVNAAVELAGVKLRCAGSQYIVSNGHFEVRLNRQGGTIRQLRSGAAVVARDQDFYGDQEYFANKNASRVVASDDVECGIGIHVADDGLHLRFEGQLRGSYRFALFRPPLWYRNEYVFTGGPRFSESWAFRSEKGFRDKRAFLTYWIAFPDADRFQFVRGQQAVADGTLADAPGRRGQNKDRPAPDGITLFQGDRPLLRLTQIAVPTGGNCQAFLQSHRLFLTLLDGSPAAMDQGRWYEFHATYDTNLNTP